MIKAGKPSVETRFFNGAKIGSTHLVKVGLLGRIGRFSSPDGRHYAQNDSVICRTDRGLETGSIMCVLDVECCNGLDGQLLRQITPDDQMIIRRIDKFRDKAFLACQQLLKDNGICATLVDVEHLFDGQSIYFYFLGEVPPEVHDLTENLAETYEKKVRFNKFTETLANGCGPNCGTEAAKCGTGGCASCGLKGACGSNK